MRALGDYVMSTGSCFVCTSAAALPHQMCLCACRSLCLLGHLVVARTCSRQEVRLGTTPAMLGVHPPLRCRNAQAPTVMEADGAAWPCTHVMPHGAG